MNVRRRLPTALALIVGAAALLVIVWIASVLQLRRAILSELQPVALQNCSLERFGSANDGGYVMCANLLDRIDAAYSYGIGGNDDWGCEVSQRYNVPVHQYDCFDTKRPACDGGTFIFHEECVGGRTEQVESRAFDTVVNQVRRNGHDGRQLLVKIDVEGSEWDSLLATPDEILSAIPQLAMELHGHDDRKILAVLHKLKQHFYLVNVHFNNWSCTRRTWPLPALAYQVLWVNKRLTSPDPRAPALKGMSPPNAPDAPGLPDCQLQ
jgi:hypothetical protein